MSPRVADGGDRATGVFGTTWGFLVFMVFLLFTVQLLFGLYARTTVTAVASDIAQDAANEGVEALGPERSAFWEAETRRRLGDYGDDAEIELSALDVDRDGTDDTLALSVRAVLPSLLPDRWVPTSPRSFSRTMRARLETFQEAS